MLTFEKQIQAVSQSRKNAATRDEIGRNGKPTRRSGLYRTRGLHEAARDVIYRMQPFQSGTEARNQPLAMLNDVEILALLREISLLRRWDARGRMRAIERFQRRVAEPEVRRYVADVRGMVRAAKGSSTSLPSELRPEGRNA